MLITNILKDLETLKQIPDEKLQEWIEEYPFAQVLHQEKALRALRNGAVDQEYWIQRAAHYSTDLNSFAKRLAMHLQHATYQESAFDEDIATIESEELPDKMGMTTVAQSSIQELSSDEELASGLAESAIISGENISLGPVEYIADEELADDLHDDLDENERSTPNASREYEALADINSPKLDAETTLVETLATRTQSTHKLKEFNKWLLTLTPLKDSRSLGFNDIEKSAIDDEVTKVGPSVISVGLAEVLSNQGHYQEAIHMFEKLSLKYPEKSDYFAAQIQKLRAL
jgi:hypothetical protein